MYSELPSIPMRFLLSSFVLVLLASGSLAHAQTNYRDACITNGANNATVVVDENVVADLGNGDALAPNDTLLAYTSDGVCAGYGVWAGEEPLSFPVAGPNAANDAPGAQGYNPGESLKIKVVNVSTDVVADFGASITFESCGTVGLPNCRDDGTYANRSLAVITALADAVLPVEMTGFDVTQQGQRAQLAWQTASETQNAGWEVQHRAAPTDGWTVLGFVEGQGTTTSAQRYTYRTDDLGVGTHRFRLKQVDVDGTSTLSDVVEATIELDQAYDLSAVYPNPLEGIGRMDLTVRTAQSVRVALYDLLGREVATLYRGSVSAHRPKAIRMDGQRHPSGAYFVRVQGETFTATRRVTIVR